MLSICIYLLIIFDSLSEIGTSRHMHGLLRHIHSVHYPVIISKDLHTTKGHNEAKEEHQNAPIPMGLTMGANVTADGIDDSVTAVVECITTAGNLTIDVRQGWSPNGAQRYLQLVEDGMYSNLPFFRVCPRYVTQFGSGAKYVAPGTQRLHYAPIPDDAKTWGRRDMNYGYVFFAGSGVNSRHSQMVLALCPSIEMCRRSGLGKAPWETPVGTIRREGFEALGRIEDSGKPYPRLEMLGQHADAGGPTQGRIESEADYLQTKYPFMQYWRSCSVTHRGLLHSRPLSMDHPGEEITVGEKGAPASAAADPLGTFRVELKIRTPDEPSGRRIVLEISPASAPLGAARFRELVEAEFFSGARFFRVIKGFMAQFGIAADPVVQATWQPRQIRDEPVAGTNERGTVSFATSGSHTRSTQLFINFGNNKFLDEQGFAPIGRVVEGMEALDAIYTGYGEGGKGDGSDGKGPAQGRLNREGNEYLLKLFPKLSYIENARVL